MKPVIIICILFKNGNRRNKKIKRYLLYFRRDQGIANDLDTQYLKIYTSFLKTTCFYLVNTILRLKRIELVLKKEN